MARKRLPVALVSGVLVAEGSWLEGSLPDVIQPRAAGGLRHCRFAAPLQTEYSSIYSTKVLFARNSGRLFFGGLFLDGFFRDRRDVLRDVAFVRIELLLHSGLAQLTRIG
jgi:hypothetical protein